MSDELTALKTELADLAASMKANHLKAAKALVDGKTQEEAYKLSGGKAKDAYAGASEMLRLNPKISQYRELVQKIAAIELLPKQIGTLEQKRAMLWEIAQKASLLKMTVKGSEDENGLGGLEVFDASAAKTAVAAIAELNKMDGDLAAIKTDNKHTHEHEGLTDEQLAQRIADLQRKVGAASAS
tara:strand:+ start:371 stop:922 length:552 start_codon:yes stop_codon:yes gene_type:complete